MPVPIHQAWDDDLPHGVDDLRAGNIKLRRYGYQPSVPDMHVGAGEVADARVHRHHAAALDQQFGHSNTNRLKF